MSKHEEEMNETIKLALKRPLGYLEIINEVSVMCKIYDSDSQDLKVFKVKMLEMLVSKLEKVKF